ncbi:UbiD family decarboxylase [Actinokineospora spheciospongiae]|uniref:UbiD family decarboxylase n=1 Tax=Actinokineospora spheciospongiae TaxID=909613 RepID=UPI000D71C5BF|nr:UbiD family decarboxylase [Actinokineospora spheciospongiae]PWW58250.1 4-hydroxy-3-polyprenylbenzoate decarboxylase [Actinokineospora spheciospongiae]
MTPPDDGGSAAPGRDLRSALSSLSGSPEDLVLVDEEVDTRSVAARYARWAGTPAPPPTGPGPAVVFQRVRTESGGVRPVLMGLYGTRERAAGLVGANPAQVPERIRAALADPIAPVTTGEREADRLEPDLRSLPIPVLTDEDAGPYLTLGSVLATDPGTGVRNLSIHRMCVRGPDTMTLWMVPGRHLEVAHRSALRRGESLPIAIHIGLPPAVVLASCAPASLVPAEVDELGIAGGLAGAPVELARCLTVDAECVADAEYVIEGELLAERMPENPGGPWATPEFLGYQGAAHPALPVVRVTGITARPGAVFQAVSGPGHEQSVLLAFGMEAAVLDFLSAWPTRVRAVHSHTAGGGQLMVVVQWEPKRAEGDDKAVRTATEALLTAFRMIKLAISVDSDVDVESDADLWWAVTTRMQADRDVSILLDVEGFPLDPTQTPEYSGGLSGVGRTAKTALDCTVPFAQRHRFRRPTWLDHP